MVGDLKKLCLNAWNKYVDSDCQCTNPFTTQVTIRNTTDVDLDKIRVLSAPNREQSEPRVLSNSNEEEDQGERESEAIPSDQEEGDFFLCSGEET